MSVGSIQLLSGPVYKIKHHNLPFDATVTATIVGEDLTAAGVNGKRVRHIRKRYEPFRITFQISASGANQAITIKNNLQRWVQRWVNLNLTFATVQRRFRNCHFMQGTIRIIASETVAPDISNETHTVIVSALMVPTQDED